MIAEAYHQHDLRSHLRTVEGSIEAAGTALTRCATGCVPVGASLGLKGGKNESFIDASHERSNGLREVQDRGELDCTNIDNIGQLA